MARITKTQRHKAAKPQPNGRAYSPPREEGWLRHQENFGEAHLSAADGVVAHKSHSGMSDHPVRSNKEASRHFLYVASTPPREEGTALTHLVAASPLCVSVFTFHFSVTVTIAPTFTFDNRSTCPLGHRISTLSACVKPPNPNVRIFSLCER